MKIGPNQELNLERTEILQRLYIPMPYAYLEVKNIRESDANRDDLSQHFYIPKNLLFYDTTLQASIT